MINSDNKILKIVALFIAANETILRVNETGKSASVTFNGENTWEEIKFASCVYTETPTDTIDGTVYNQKLECTLAGDDKELLEILDYYKSAKPIIKFDYNDGTEKIIGNKTNYCTLIFSASSEEFITKHQLIFTRENYQSALFFS